MAREMICPRRVTLPTTSSNTGASGFTRCAAGTARVAAASIIGNSPGCNTDGAQSMSVASAGSMSSGNGSGRPADHLGRLIASRSSAAGSSGWRGAREKETAWILLQPSPGISADD